MRAVIIIIISIITAALLFLLVLAASVNNNAAVEEARFTRRNISYSSRDKAPYGAFVAHRLLQDQFNTRPKTITRSFASTYRKNAVMKDYNNLYFIVAGKLYVTAEDVNAMYNYVSNGNRLYLVLEETDSLLEATFNFQTKYMADSAVTLQFGAGENSQSFSNPHLAPDTLFSAKGIPMNNALALADSAVTTILGTNASHKPNFFRINAGNGQLYVLLNPMTWTNNFLLEKDNIKALETQMAYLPQFPKNVYWDEFYKQLRGRQDGDFSNWQVLMRHPSLRWALWLTVLLLLLYVLFEGKRRQRLIPPKPVLHNSSLDFAETLGRLYYLHHNNKNLAQKMIQHLLEHIRTHYFMNTGQLNAEFISNLSRKSGRPPEVVNNMISQVHAIRMADTVSDEDLQYFYDSIYQFYIKPN
ncbi:hypothetical protein DLD77_06350 [Chitinophaga alhagiae]|uniref:DUF4350 domain-containing protein n=1 Tax=Chitinophaga alhagiae TaxID=2203219 RepID=A0ABN5LPP0_9BACT|nr:DUF4350 domain-containing protein [Chitinophaga alhagiae]AWO01336.1 hypothetical protein DLD77_06350 [Chitinophaga alhagiae]